MTDSLIQKPLRGYLRPKAAEEEVLQPLDSCTMFHKPSACRILRREAGCVFPDRMRQILPTHRAKFARRGESGFIITLVAVFLLFVVGAMAALSIDIASFYTARSEAQIAADAAASRRSTRPGKFGTDLRSDRMRPMASGSSLNPLPKRRRGGRRSKPGRRTERRRTHYRLLLQPPGGQSHRQSAGAASLRRHFSRAFGEPRRYRSPPPPPPKPTILPSRHQHLSPPQALPVALSCVKPWLITEHRSHAASGNPIFTTSTGAISATDMLGQQLPGLLVNCYGRRLHLLVNGAPAAWSYYPGDTSSTGEFAAPPSTSVSCSPATTNFTSTDYQLAIAGCVQTPICCNQKAVHIDLSTYSQRDPETQAAVSCLSHSAANAGDTIDTDTFPAGPFEFLVGNDNPLVAAGLTAGSDAVVSDSLVTVPIFDNTTYTVGNTDRGPRRLRPALRESRWLSDASRRPHLHRRQSGRLRHHCVGHPHLRQWRHRRPRPPDHAPLT